MLCNKFCYREIERFGKRNAQFLVKYSGFVNGRTPSHVSIRSFVMSIDFESVHRAFHKWASSYVPIELGEWVSVDGKCIRSTVSDYGNQYQNFASLVSFFSHKREQVLGVGLLENKKGHEPQTVEALLEMLDLKDVIFTLDALYCKKNSSKNRKQTMPLRG